MTKKNWSLLVVFALLLGIAGFLLPRTSFANSDNVDTAAVDASALEGVRAEPFGVAPTGGLIWDYGPMTGSQAGCWSNYTASQNFAEDVSFAASTDIASIVIYTCIGPVPGSTVHIKIRHDDGAGNPSNTPLYDADVTPTSWSPDPVTGGYAVTADLPAPFAAAAGTIYWIGLSGNGFELGQYSVQTPDDGHMAQFSGPTFSFHTAVGDQMFQLLGNAPQVGDIAVADIRAVQTTGAPYVALILNGDGVNANSNHLFIKVQQAHGTDSFTAGSCRKGNNGDSFGQGDFPLTEHFKSARMLAMRLAPGGNKVFIRFTNIDEGTKPDQHYTCNGAPAPVGNKIGVASDGNGARIDNFSDGATVLDTFTYNGALGATGNWVDAAAGMVANGSSATGGGMALSFWVGQACQPVGTDVSLNPGLSVSISTGATSKYWLVRFYFANGTSLAMLQTGLPACYNWAFNTPYVPTNPPITSICSFVYDPAVPGVVAQDCVAIP